MIWHPANRSARSQSKDFAESATCIAYSILKLQRQRQDPHYKICKNCLVDEEKFVLHFNATGHWVDISASSSEQYVMFTAKVDTLRLLVCQVLSNPVKVLPAFTGHPRRSQASLAICRTKAPRPLCNATNRLSSSSDKQLSAEG